MINPRLIPTAFLAIGVCLLWAGAPIAGTVLIAIGVIVDFLINEGDNHEPHDTRKDEQD